MLFTCGQRLDLEILVIGPVNFVFVNWLCSLTQSKFAQSAHELSPNLSPTPPSLAITTHRQKSFLYPGGLLLHGLAVAEEVGEGFAAQHLLLELFLQPQSLDPGRV